MMSDATIEIVDSTTIRQAVYLGTLDAIMNVNDNPKPKWWQRPCLVFAAIHMAIEVPLFAAILWRVW